MPKLIIVMALAITLLLGATAPVDSTPDVPETVAHTNTQVRNVCIVLDEALVTGDPGWQYNNIGVAYFNPLHGFGLHWAQCCLYVLSTGRSIYALYLFGWNHVDYPQNDPYCRF